MVLRWLRSFVANCAPQDDMSLQLFWNDGTAGDRSGVEMKVAVISKYADRNFK